MLDCTAEFVAFLETHTLGPVSTASQLDWKGRVNDPTILSLEMCPDATRYSADMHLPPPLSAGNASTWHTDHNPRLALMPAEPPAAEAPAGKDAEPVVSDGLVDRLDACFREQQALIQQRFADDAARAERYNDGLMTQLSACAKIMQQQTSMLAQHTELGKAQDTAPPRAGATPMLAYADQPPGRASSQPQPHGGTGGPNGAQRNPRGGSPGGRPRQRPIRRDEKGNIIVRMVDKPKIEWDEIPEAVRGTLRNRGVRNKDEWDSADERKVMCTFCAPETDHWLTRCFAIFMTTEKGRKFMESVKSKPRAAGVRMLCAHCDVSEADETAAVLCLMEDIDEYAPEASA